MSLSADERRVLLAAAASPLILRESDNQLCRVDTPVPVPVDDAAWLLLDAELLEWVPRDHRLQHRQARLTDAGIEEVETLRSVLGRGKRRLLRRIGEAGELLRRESPAGVVDWVEADRVPHLGPGQKILPGVAYDDKIQDLVARGLVALLAGGTRAVLTGAGQWCAEETETEI